MLDATNDPAILDRCLRIYDPLRPVVSVVLQMVGIAPALLGRCFGNR